MKNLIGMLVFVGSLMAEPVWAQVAPDYATPDVQEEVEGVDDPQPTKCSKRVVRGEEICISADYYAAQQRLANMPTPETAYEKAFAEYERLVTGLEKGQELSVQTNDPTVCEMVESAKNNTPASKEYYRGVTCEVVAAE